MFGRGGGGGGCSVAMAATFPSYVLGDEQLELFATRLPPPAVLPAPPFSSYSESFASLLSHV